MVAMSLVWFLVLVYAVVVHVRRLQRRHRHAFQPVSSRVEQTYEAWGGRAGAYPAEIETVVLTRCECGALSTLRLEGRWTWEEVRGR